MKISVLTPTADRPVGFALAERYMARQTRQPDEWIVADGGAEPVECTRGQVHIRKPNPPGPRNFTANLAAGLAAATGDLLVIWEDDDYYFGGHLAALERQAERFPLVGAEDRQRYYNVAHRMHRLFMNTGASLCQTGIARSLWPAFGRWIREMDQRLAFGVDTNLWRSVPRAQWGLARELTVVGIKGLPGRAGLGVGHRPGAGWRADPDLSELRRLIGDDAEVYAPMALTASLPQIADCSP